MFDVKFAILGSWFSTFRAKFPICSTKFAMSCESIPQPATPRPTSQHFSPTLHQLVSPTYAISRAIDASSRPWFFRLIQRKRSEQSLHLAPEPACSYNFRYCSCIFPLSVLLALEIAQRFSKTHFSFVIAIVVHCLDGSIMSGVFSIQLTSFLEYGAWDVSNKMCVYLFLSTGEQSMPSM